MLSRRAAARHETRHVIAGFAGEPGSGYLARTGLTRTCGSKLVDTKLTLHLPEPIGGRSTLHFDYTRCAKR